MGAAVSIFERLFEYQKATHQHIFSVFPFSIGDLFYISLGFIFMYFLIKILKKKSRKIYVLRLLILLNALYFIYQLFWGMLYFQIPISDRLPKAEITLQETQNLTLKYLNLCRETRNHVKEDQNGVFVVTDLKKIKKEILANQKELPPSISQKKATAVNVFKESVFKGVMSYSGILGYYNPFTAEAQYNPELPSTYLPFTLAHESMHQLGFAREQEANFTGYLVGRHSSNLELKYSTQYFVLRSLLSSLQEKNPEFVKETLKKYSSGMKRDRLSEKKFVKEHEGFLDVFFSFTNDLFLKTNQQEGSVTYSYFIELLVRYEKLHLK